eukprot:snap_masked-scaffold_8-processed-gene-3.35-mRNA-1 protein AED:1.00 eAED:1.00 QI:0/-1/0/0/-1/1/1/0/309
MAIKYFKIEDENQTEPYSSKYSSVSREDLLLVRSLTITGISSPLTSKTLNYFRTRFSNLCVPFISFQNITIDSKAFLNLVQNTVCQLKKFYFLEIRNVKVASLMPYDFFRKFYRYDSVKDLRLISFPLENCVRGCVFFFQQSCRKLLNFETQSSFTTCTFIKSLSSKYISISLKQLKIDATAEKDYTYFEAKIFNYLLSCSLLETLGKFHFSGYSGNFPTIKCLEQILPIAKCIVKVKLFGNHAKSQLYFLAKFHLQSRIKKQSFALMHFRTKPYTEYNYGLKISKLIKSQLGVWEGKVNMCSLRWFDK